MAGSLSTMLSDREHEQTDSAVDGGRAAGYRDNVARYSLYGLCLRSEWPLPCPEAAESCLAHVELFEAQPSFFLKASRGIKKLCSEDRWHQFVRLSDSSDYLRWSGLFEFLVSPDGHRIAGRPLDHASRDMFHAHLLGQVLSFALIKLGIEPVHATAVVIDGSTVAFIGDSGYGKSTLAAAFLLAGHPLLTDDLLVVREKSDSFVAYSGPSRIKLFPETAKAFLGKQVSGVPMNPYSRKLVIPLGSTQSSQAPAPLRAIYMLSPQAAKSRGKRVTIRKRSQRQAFLALTANTFNTKVTTSDRLAQQFALAARLSSKVPVKSLVYPRNIGRLSEVVEAVRADLI